jgi:hypothetical protein
MSYYKLVERLQDIETERNNNSQIKIKVKSQGLEVNEVNENAQA